MSGSHRASAHRRSAAVPGPRSSAEGGAPQSRGRRRKARKRGGGKALMGGTAVLLAAAAGWFTVGQGRAIPGFTTAGAPDRTEADVRRADAAPLPADARTEAPVADRSNRDDGTVAVIPGLGPSFLAKVPAETTQLVVASGKAKDSADTTITLWTRTPDGRWKAGQAWAGHNGYKGWTQTKKSGDLHSPVGVFALTDAGGRKADPGSKLPYDKDPGFVVGGTGFNGEQLAGSFDYVVAINYNRVAGRSPLDTTHPEGAAKGGGVWLHVDHGGPTHACVSLPEADMIELIRTLDPAAHPMIAMGDAATLAT